MLLDYLARAPARIVAYDVNFAEADTRTGFEFGGSTWSGAESDRALVDSVKKAGNVLLPADATYEGQTVGEATEPAGRRFPPPGTTRRRAQSDLPAVQDARRCGRRSRTQPVRPRPQTDRCGTPSRSCASARRRCRRSAWQPPFVRQTSIPSTVHLVDDVLQVGERRMPLLVRRVKSQDGPRSLLLGPRQLPRSGAARRSQEPSLPAILVLRSAVCGGAAAGRADDRRSIRPMFKDKIVFVGVTASGLFDVFETPFARGQMPGIQSSRRRRRRHAVEPVHRARSATAVRLATVVGRRRSPSVSSPRSLPAWWATAITAAFRGLFAWAGTRLFAGGYWLNLIAAASLAAASRSSAASLSVLRRGARETEDEEAVRAVRLEGRATTSSWRTPTLARLGGQRREMTVLFSDIRGFTTRHRARAAGRDRRHAERVLHPHGGDRLPAPRDARQVRRRHGDGAVRRAARRSGARRPRRRGGARHDRRSCGPAQRAVERAEGGLPTSTSASASTPGR